MYLQHQHGDFFESITISGAFGKKNLKIIYGF